MVLACALRPTQEAAANDPCLFESNRFSIWSRTGQLGVTTDGFSQRSLKSINSFSTATHSLLERGDVICCLDADADPTDIDEEALSFFTPVRGLTRQLLCVCVAVVVCPTAALR